MSGVEMWVRANWQDLIGIPLPEYGPWLLRDTPLDVSTIKMRYMTGRDRDGRLVAYEDGTAKHVMGGPTKPETVQMRYRTREFRSREKGGVVDMLARQAPVSRDVIETFAARPEADLYVVEVFPDPFVSSDIAVLESEFELDVQLIGVGVEEPPEYPGAFVEVDLAELLDVESPVMRAIPSADVLVLSPRIRGSHVPRELRERTEPRCLVVNPEEGILVEMVEEEILISGGASGG